MQIFPQERIRTHAIAVEWPDFLGTVALGESFIVETERYNNVNGPIAIEGILAGENVAVHIESIEILPPFESPNAGPFSEGSGDNVPLVYRDGMFHFPGGIVLRANPSVGNVAVLPAPTETILEIAHRFKDSRGWRAIVNDPRGRHCHQDCKYLTAGSTIHMKAQVDCAGLCLADVHGYIGEGEMGSGAIETAARITVRVERSKGWYVDWPLIETEEEIMVFSSVSSIPFGEEPPGRKYVNVVRQLYAEMRKVVAARVSSTISEVNPIVATALDIRNCALYGLQNFRTGNQSEDTQPDRDIAVVGVLPKSIFAAHNCD